MAERARHDLTIAEAADRLRSGRLTATDLVEAALERIGIVEDRTQAYVRVLADEARRQAVEADREIVAGRSRGPLQGIPIALKDIYDLAGVPTTASSAVFADHRPDRDSAAVERLKAAGAVLIGKTVTDEFAYGTVCPPTRNPWDLTRSPGGSSGGSAVAVAAGECLAALGSDTAGSIRTPAALNGVVGLKPTYGRISKRGLVPLAWSMDAAGPLTQTVRDAAILLGVLAGHDPADPASAMEPVPDYLAGLEAGVTGLRLAVPTNYFFPGCDLEVERVVRAAVQALAGQGAEIVELAIPAIEYSFGAGRAIVRAEATAYHNARLRDPGAPYGANARLQLEAGYFLPAAAYLKAQQARQLIKRGFQSVLERVDVIVCPTLPTTAVPVEWFESAVVGSPAFEVVNQFVRWAYPVNLAGVPALSVPCGFTNSGLPIGLQIIGRPFDEATILRVGRASEAIGGWSGRRPSL